MNVLQFCECQSWSCDLSVMMPIEDALEIQACRGSVIIVDGCEHGPDPTDTLLELRDGYSLYHESAETTLRSNVYHWAFRRFRKAPFERR